MQGFLVRVHNPPDLGFKVQTLWTLNTTRSHSIEHGKLEPLRASATPCLRFIRRAQPVLEEEQRKHQSSQRTSSTGPSGTQLDKVLLAVDSVHNALNQLSMRTLQSLSTGVTRTLNAHLVGMQLSPAPILARTNMGMTLGGPMWVLGEGQVGGLMLSIRHIQDWNTD